MSSNGQLSVLVIKLPKTQLAFYSTFLEKHKAYRIKSALPNDTDGYHYVYGLARVKQRFYNALSNKL